MCCVGKQKVGRRRAREGKTKTVSGSTQWQDQNKTGEPFCRHTPPSLAAACRVQRRTGHRYPLCSLCPRCVSAASLLRICCVLLLRCAVGGCCCAKVLRKVRSGFGSSASSAGSWAADKQWFWRAMSGLGQDSPFGVAFRWFSGPAGADWLLSGPKAAVQAVPAVEMTPSDGQLQASPVDAAVPHTFAAQPRPSKTTRPKTTPNKTSQ